MTPRDRLTTALELGRPDRTPLSIYHWMMTHQCSGADYHDPDWRRLVDMGLVPVVHERSVRRLREGVSEEQAVENRGADQVVTRTLDTPAGRLRCQKRNGWWTEHWVKTPEDYRVLTWLARHTELAPDYEQFEQAEQRFGPEALVIVQAPRTAAMQVNLDWAGTERFCIDLASETTELFEAIEAIGELFLEEIELIARGPGRYVKSFETLTISMLGPERYRQLLAPVYRLAVPMLESGDKRYVARYDGGLSIIADQIAASPLHIIESLTEPPEGDMTYDQCRAAWPEKAFWAHINYELYGREPEALRQGVLDRRARAGAEGLAFEISEEVPPHWRESIAAVLQTLDEAA